MEVLDLCSSALYIYLPLSGLVLFFPSFCKYLYLNQNILAKYKTNKKNHDVIVSVKGNSKGMLWGVNMEIQGITELADSG